MTPMAALRPRTDAPPAWRAYTFALGVTVFATGLRAAIDPWAGDRLPYITYFAAVALAGWYGGLRAAIAATLLGVAGALYCFVPPRMSFAVAEPVHGIGLAMFLVMGGVVAAFAGALRGSAQLAAARSDELRTTLASIGDAVIATDRDGVVTLLNGVAVQLTGWSEADAVGQPLARVFDIRDEVTGAPASNPAVRALAEGTIVGLANHTVLVRRDGTRTPIDDSAAPIRDGDGNVTGCVLVFRDVRERRAAEEAQAALAAIVASSNDAIVGKSLDGTIRSWNAGAERIFGYRADEAIGQSVLLIVPPERHDEERSILERLRCGERIEHFETVRIARGGRRVDLSIAIAPLFDRHGEIIGAANVGRDITERKRAMDLVRHRERLFGALVNASSQAIWSYRPARDAVGALDEASAAWWREFTGQSEAERTAGAGTGWLDAVHPRDRAAASANWRAMQDGTEPTVAEFRVRRADGAWRWLRMRGVPTRDGDGQVEWAGTLVDVTERKEAELALQRSEERYRRLVELLPVAVYTVAADGVLTFYNAHAALLWGRSPQLGDPSERFCGSLRAFSADGAAMDHEQTPVALALRDGRSFRNVEAVVERPDGSRITVLVNIDPIRDEAGAVVGAINAFHDTSALRRAQEAVRASEEAFRSLVAVLTDVPWAADVTGAVVDEQPGWAAYTGQSYAQYRGLGWLDAVHPDDRATAGTAWRAACATGADYRAPYRLWHAASGRYRHVETRATRLHDASGAVRGWIGCCTDVHDQTVAREELVAADRRKDEFLATLAHELRNPLAPVRNSLEIMRRARGEPGLVAQARDTMDRQVRLMERLMDDLLDVSRITRNRLELRRAPTELGAVLQQAVEACRPLCIAAGQRLSVRLPDEPVWLHADGMRLVQLFSNLLNNASKYSERGGHIRLDAARERDHVVVRVRDDGIGIPPELMPSIFDMFTQAERSLERSRGGLGIGLTLVRQLVELHHGTVTAHSDGDGRGSEFVVRLPVGPLADATRAELPAQAHAPAPAAANGVAPPRRFLVVDDNQDAATTLAMLLRLGGDEVHVAHDGEQAVAVADTLRPEVVLLDLGLPKKNGYDVCRELRERPWGRDATIVALTGWGQSEDRRRSEDAGFDGHLVKPVDHAVLMQLLANARRPA
jgi:PAS domain S-box-containing protein